MPLSGELFPLWVWLDEGLEVGWSKVEFEGEGWERGRGTGFTEVCSDCTGLCRWERKKIGFHVLIGFTEQVLVGGHGNQRKKEALHGSSRKH